jgi:class 3 adenylate cyclase
MAPAEREHVLVAVLFTDIVGSTELAADMGDEAWKRLLREHHAIVRRLVKNGGGRVVDTAGDGVFAVFERPAAAVRCAFEAIRAVRQIGVEIRAGVHFGESESADGKVSGIAVHTASRVMSLAQPGEVLVTRTVKDLVAGRRIIVTDRGSHDLKGIPSSWQVFGVEEVEGSRTEPPIDPVVAENRRERFAEQTSSRHREGVVAAGVAVLVALAVIAVVSRLDDLSTPDPPTRPKRLLRIDLGTQDRMWTAVGEAPTSVAIGEGSVWVASFDEEMVYRVDPQSSAIQAHIDLGEPPHRMAVGAAAVWVTTSRSLFRIDPISNTIEHRFPLGACDVSDACTTDVAIADGMVWAIHADTRRLVEIDPERNTVVLRVPLNSLPVALATGDGAVWMSLLGPPPIIVRFDIASETQALEALPAEDSDAACLTHDVGAAYATELCVAIAVGERAVWVVTPGEFNSELWQLDPKTGKHSGPSQPLRCCALTLFPLSELVPKIWVGLSSGELAIVPEALGRQEEEISVGGSVTDVALGYGAIWVTMHGPGSTG